MSQFYSNKTNEDGKSIYCKECTKLNAKKYYQKKMLKLASEHNGITIKDDILPSNLISLGERKSELALKLAVIQRLMLTVNSEVRELASFLNEEPSLVDVHNHNNHEHNHNNNGSHVLEAAPEQKNEPKVETKPEPKTETKKSVKAVVKDKIKPGVKTRLKPGPKPGFKRKAKAAVA